MGTESSDLSEPEGSLKLLLPPFALSYPIISRMKARIVGFGELVDFICRKLCFHLNDATKETTRVNWHINLKLLQKVYL